MDVEERFNLITRNTEEVLTEDDLRNLLEGEEDLKHYIGFEISGKIHLGTGLMCMSKVKDFMDAGVDVTIFLADWHSWINDKLGGDIETIRKFAVGYFKEGMIASLKCFGGDTEKLKFVMGSELYTDKPEFWATMLDVSKHTTLARIKRSITIMGKKEGDSVDFAKLIYPPMQVADIFVQGLNIAHAGIDQRKAQVIAREVAPQMNLNPLLNKKGEKIKPIAIHHHLLLGLGKPPVWPIEADKMQDLWASMKMSKSKPDTCIFIHDSEDDVKRKIKNAFCPEGEIELNPILDWTRHIIFREDKAELHISRPEKFGGDLHYSSYADLEKDFADKQLHPADLKAAVAEKVCEILKPAREHFAEGKPKEMLEELDKLIAAQNKK